MIELNREELAWAAGFFDGEGYVGNVRSNKHYRRAMLHVHQIRLEPLSRFQAALGGNIGILSGPYSTGSNPNSSPTWRFYTTSFMETQAVIALLWYWLSPPKREQARSALLGLRQYFAERPNKRSKHNYYTRPRKCRNVARDRE